VVWELLLLHFYFPGFWLVLAGFPTFAVDDSLAAHSKQSCEEYQTDEQTAEAVHEHVVGGTVAYSRG
jgi:hypothetical protein